MYNNTFLSQRAVILAMLGIAANFVFSFLSWFFYPKQTTTHAPTDLDSPDVDDLGAATSLDLTHQSAKFMADTVDGHGSPRQRSTRRLDSHCSEDVLLDSEM